MAAALCAPEVLKALEEEEEAARKRLADAPAGPRKQRQLPLPATWHPEYGSWMVEATPGRPYANEAGDLLDVEANMLLRRARIAAACPPGVVPMSLVAFPLLGAGATTDPPLPPGGPYSLSTYLPDAAPSPHPRFG